MDPPTAADTIDQRVARGATMLDEVLPGWEDRIQLAFLRPEHDHDCILGQAFESATFAIDLLGLEDPAALGFDLVAGEDEGAWPRIGAAWTALILNRRAARPQHRA